MSNTFLWHDYETFGRDPARERPVQFAAIRTDENLEEIEDGTMIYCRQSQDYLPDPGSCMVHGVLPQTANDKGLSEWEFANKIHQMMFVPNTCTVGYNSIRFDDEFTRQLLFRNLFDPYSREWRDGNSRWDLIDVVRLSRALRPDGINWPTDADDKPTNKLELLTAANGIEHGEAHDALADVRATIAIARLLKDKQPNLFNYTYQNRRKQFVLSTAIDLIKRSAVLHVSGMYPAKFGHISMVMPLGPHPTNSNGILAYDLRHDPTDLINLPAELVSERLFTSAKNLPEGTQRIAVKTIHANRCPILVPTKTMDESTAKKWQLDRNQCLKHREQLLAAPQVLEKLAWVFSNQNYEEKNDPDLTLYSGQFASDRDKNIMESLQQKFQYSKPCPAASDDIFDDKRLNELYFRLTARNWPEKLSATELSRWNMFCHERVHLGKDGFRSLDQYKVIAAELKHNADRSEDIEMAEKLEAYGDKIANYSKH